MAVDGAARATNQNGVCRMMVRDDSESARPLPHSLARSLTRLLPHQCRPSPTRAPRQTNRRRRTSTNDVSQPELPSPPELREHCNGELERGIAPTAHVPVCAFVYMSIYLSICLPSR
eukprot:GHVU01208127.1.p1 GENE.GHVU01208127.1~~GHVU01208127.1.p1  ORF type:complete len:117 (-),score=3.14 GHVU01208127.1:152-502(-)